MPTLRSRREDYSESTRTALVSSAVDLFTKRGYAGTPLDEVAKRARVTKGALYHHFSGKQALFEAVFDEVESRALEPLEAVRRGPLPPWERAMTALRMFIDQCQDPTYQRIVVHEGPVVMGWERWREAEDNFSYGLVRGCLEDLVEAGEVDDVPVETTARLLFGALSSAAMMIAASSEPKKVGAEVELVLVTLLSSIRRA